MCLSQLSLFRQDRLHALTDWPASIDRNIQTTNPAGMGCPAALCGADQMDLFVHAPIRGEYINGWRLV